MKKINVELTSAQVGVLESFLDIISDPKAGAGPKEVRIRLSKKEVLLLRNAYYNLQDALLQYDTENP